MANKLINKDFYEAILRFEQDDKAQDYYYKVMSTETGRIGTEGRMETIRDQILRVYSMLFCDDLGAVAGQIADFEDVAATADRLHIGNMSYDPRHWYRMQHHFPVIDEDNYERFAALVIADLNAGPLREAAREGGDTLLVGELDSLSMTEEERKHQIVRNIGLREKGETS